MNSSQENALIGHTGFVGGNLAAQRAYDRCFNSRNIHEIRGRAFDTVVCAGVGAVKWKANKEPEADWAGIQALLEPLATIQAKRFVLISTIDVYPNPVDVTEDDLPSEENHAYGRHRLKVEQFVSERFPLYHIVRLPGLFGNGLKKNVIYDLLHDNCLEMIQPASAFQYYNLAHLTADLDRAVSNGLKVLNMATEPLSTRSIIDSFASGKEVGSKAGPVGRYDFRSKYDHLWNCSGGYLYNGATVLREIGEFMTVERGRIH